MEALRDRHYASCDDARHAFDELCSMVDNLLIEREEKREAALTRFTFVRERRRLMLEKNRRLREKYLVLLDQ